jgi:MFS family permease
MFRWWFFSQVLSASGTMTQAVALSWLVLKLTGSGVDLGLITTFTFLPMLLAGPWAGAIVDRVDRRRLLIVTQSLFTALATLLAVLTAVGGIRLWMLFAIAFATGMVGAPDAAARQVYAIDLVGTDRLASAISLNEVVLNTSRVVGPAVGGALLATVGVSACCIVNAVSYVPPLIVLLTFHASLPKTNRAHDAVPGTFLTGLRYAWANPAIRMCMFMAIASGMLFNLNVPLPLLATRVFHLGGGGYGLMMSVFGVGGIVGGLLAASGHHKPTRRSVGALAAFTGAAILATACAFDVEAAYVGLGVTGCLSIWFIARANALVQFETDPALRGRVMGVWSMALPGCEPFTSPAVGWVSETAGPRDGFAMAGIALLLIAAVGWRSLFGRTKR